MVMKVLYGNCLGSMSARKRKLFSSEGDSDHGSLVDSDSSDEFHMDDLDEKNGIKKY